VLVVDDSADGRKIISSMLGCLGLKADAAESARDACRQTLAAATAGQPYDLILMDTLMPEVDGYEAAGLLRSMSYTGRIVALATGSIFERPREQAIVAGCDGYAVKPITFECIRDVVRRWMPQGTVARQRRDLAG
jgi:CheY-like chemotaxis protein